MVCYFPALLPDELLYSRLARYHLHICSQSAKQTLDDLFGSRTVRASVDLQCHLGALSKRIPGRRKGSLDRLLASTLLTYYGAFVPHAVVQSVRRAMIVGPAAGIHARLGIAAGKRAPPNRLRWCLDCNAEARIRYGEPYWHRAHQLPGVLVCPVHEGRLRKAVLPERVGQHEFIAASAQTCPVDDATEPDYGTQQQILLSELARRSALLLDTLGHHHASFDDLTRICRGRLVAAGLAKPSGRLCLSALEDAARERLAPLRPLFREAQSLEWLIAMGRKHRRSFSPLQHLLFGLITSSANKIPVTSHNPRKRVFLAEDPAFERRLRAAAKSEVSLRGVARKLGVDPRTVLRHSSRLSLGGPWSLSGQVVRSRPPTPEDEMKARWLAIQGSGCGRTELRRQVPAVWVWLKRHCPEWLEAHSPAPILPRSHHPRVDWATLDCYLADAITKAADEIIQREPPQKVTRSAIARIIDRQAWFEPRLHKLPRSTDTLNHVTETLDSFRLRRIQWARAALLGQGTVPAPWRIRRLAGLPEQLSAQLERALTGSTV